MKEILKTPVQRALICIVLYLLVLPVEGKGLALLCGLGKALPNRPLPLQASALLPPADSQSLPTVIDVMFLYTADAVFGAGDEALLRERLQESVAEANYLYTNSQVNISINPVYMGRIAYTETGDIQEDLQYLANGTGEFAAVSRLRDDYKADIVCLITEFENLGIGGLAWDIPPQRGNSRSAFLAVRRLALGANITLAHELGHLLGCAHDREHAGDPNDLFYTVRRPYIFGNRLEIDGVTYIDVMAYEPGVSLPYFSNPRMSLDGVPLGVAEGQALPSDTARTINETAPYAAMYREAHSRMEFAAAHYEVDRSAGAIDLHVSRSGDLSESTAVTVTFASTNSAQAGVDYVLPGSATIVFASGQKDATFQIQLLANDRSFTKTLTLTLVSPIGTHGIGLIRETTVLIRDRLPVVQVDPVSTSEKAGIVQLLPSFTGPVLSAPPKISWHLQGLSAIAGSDFVDQSGDLTMQVISNVYQVDPIQIALINDDVPEPDKTFIVIFEGTTHGGIEYGPVTNEVRLVDDDRSGALKDSPGAQLNPDGSMNVAVRNDHKLLIWGSFSELRGIRRTALALLNRDGTIDEEFRPPELLSGHRAIPHMENAYVGSVQMLPDGKFLVAGEFSRADGKPRNTLARLNADGSLDEEFGKDLKFDGAVDVLALQRDGKILVGGAFESINGQKRSFIARLNADGTVDETFAPNGGPTSSWTVFILTIALQPDDKILIGGFFEKVDGTDCSNLARLNPDGTLDTSFEVKDTSGPVRQVILQKDGRILVGGLFDAIGGQPIRKLARLDPDGVVDLSFVPPMPNAEVSFLTCLPDQHILINGAFTRLAGKDKRYLALLKPDGTLDESFDLGTGPDERIGATSVHADGSLYLPGKLRKLDGLPAGGIARVYLANSGGAIQKSEVTPQALLIEAAVFPGSYSIESSVDLVHWNQIQTLEVGGFSRTAAATLARPAPRQFTRLRSQGP